MKTTLKTAAVAGALLASASAMAIDVNINRNTGYFTGSGGEFTLGPVPAAWYSSYSPEALYNLGSGIGIQTFCLERDENVASNPNQAVINQNGIAFGGGVNTNSGDPISKGTAWLYSLFSGGALDDLGYDYTPGAGRAATAGALQDMIWALEDEQSIDLGNMFYGDLIAKFGSVAAAKADNAGEFPARVLNITKDGAPAQDMLIRVPDAGGTLTLLGLGLAGVAVARRRPSV